MWFNKKNNKKDIVVTGAKGQLGSYLVKCFSKLAFDSKSCIGRVMGINIDDLDLSNAEDVSMFFSKSCSNFIDIDYVVHCAAATDTAAIENDPAKYYASNVLATRNLAEACAHNGIKLIFISTDYVLSELSPCIGGVLQEFPVNQYGIQKLLAEREVQCAYANAPEDYIILRSSWMFGNSHKSFIEKLLWSMFKNIGKQYAGKNILPAPGDKPQFIHNVVSDAYGRPTPVWTLCDIVVDAISGKINIDRNSQRAINAQLDAPQISRFQWAMMIKDSFDEALQHNEYASGKECINDFNALNVCINPVASAESGIKMHHPGIVQYDAPARHSLDAGVYKICTDDYVHPHIEELVDLACNAYDEGAREAKL